MGTQLLVITDMSALDQANARKAIMELANRGKRIPIEKCPDAEICFEINVMLGVVKHKIRGLHPAIIQEFSQAPS